VHDGIINCGTSREEILFAIEKAVNSSFSPIKLYGDGNSDQLFLNSIMNDSFWLISKQKMFKDIL
jgi:UDP-N-acetylglucosamine 2-epimerase (hydrolysing)